MLKHICLMSCLMISAALGQEAAPAAAPASSAPHARGNDVLTATPLKLWSDRLVVSRDHIATAILIDHENFFEEVVYRDGTGSPEEHDHWNDNMIVQEGSATLVYGGTLTGTTISPSGEARRGGTLTDGQTLEMHAGDLITIPAGVPHQMILTPGTHFRFIVIKNRF